MDKLEKVIKGIEQCLICGIAEDKCIECPYRSDTSCITRIKRDALELLKEHKEHEELLTILGYHWTGSGETLALCKKSKDGDGE